MEIFQIKPGAEKKTDVSGHAHWLDVVHLFSFAVEANSEKLSI